MQKLLGEKDVTYRVARTPEDEERIHDLRYKVFGLESNPPYVHSRDAMVDGYDKIAVNLIAESRGELVGSLRLVDHRNLEDLNGNPHVKRNKEGNVIFPMEHDFPEICDTINEKYASDRNVIVIERLAVSKDYWKNGIAKGLYANCYEYVKKTGVDDAFIIINCEMHSRGRDDIPKEERVKIPDAYTTMGFYTIKDIFWYPNFNAYAAVMHLPKECVTKKLKMLTFARKLSGKIADFDECIERLPD
jgi:predicted GNAT family N-acyltransferase